MTSGSRSCVRNWVLYVLMAAVFAAPAWTQMEFDAMLRDRIAVNLHRIETAGERHATEGELGRLWVQMAYDYQGEGDMQRSEEAYARALALLRRPVSRDYGVALDGLGMLYLVTGRLRESERLRREALAVYQGLHDEAGEATIHINLGINLLHLHRFKEAERETSVGVREMEVQTERDENQLIAGLIASSYAKCFQNRCEEALVEADRALTLARAKFAKDAIEVVVALIARGFDDWRTGAEAEGERAMLEAIDLVREKKDMS
ncbi:MAG TPA: tetratricopeptide repeat protein [Edaphobacter sp.]|jgi:tetratricopeptide (TPR) repeat protein|nr:tetratricopeptide repeat protein [Edaphobacter sp.]